MRYDFACDNKQCCIGVFEEEQPMESGHYALCPVCRHEARRLFSGTQFFFKDCLYHKDGSKQDPSELPTVYGGNNKFFSGFGESKQLGGNND